MCFVGSEHTLLSRQESLITSFLYRTPILLHKLVSSRKEILTDPSVGSIGLVFN